VRSYYYLIYYSELESMRDFACYVPPPQYPTTEAGREEETEAEGDDAVVPFADSRLRLRL
jgi:hypothetical protein